MKVINIRIAGEGDISKIRMIAYKTWPIAFRNILSEEQLKYMLRKFYSSASLFNQMEYLKHTFLLAEENDKNCVGFASFSVHKEDPGIFHLNKLYVLPDHQKSYTGTLLVEKVIQLARAKDGISLQLNVNRNNAALHFYTGLGFMTIREEDIDIGNGFFMNDFVMERKI